MNEPKLWSHSAIDGNGNEYISVVLDEPQLNDNDLYQGGKLLFFRVDHKKQKTVCNMGHMRNGAPAYEKEIKVWNDEILAESECVKFAKGLLNQQEQF